MEKQDYAKETILCFHLELIMSLQHTQVGQF